MVDFSIMKRKVPKNFIKKIPALLPKHITRLPLEQSYDVMRYFDSEDYSFYKKEKINKRRILNNGT